METRAFLLTHPVWDVTFHRQVFASDNQISTHTSRVGCDHGRKQSIWEKSQISTHTSRVGCDG